MSRSQLELFPCSDPQPDLRQWDWIVVNTSGGKDSQTALRKVCLKADSLGVLDRVVAVHADLGRVEWPGVPELAERQASAYGVEFFKVRKRNLKGEEGEVILDMVRRRRKWPSPTQRYCTSDFKRTPCSRVFTTLGKRSCAAGTGRPRLLNVFGFRSEESPFRRKLPSLWRDDRLTNSAKEVWTWLPIQDWLLDEVWADIRASGIPYHFAYDLGMPRLSCCFCIFAPKAALMIAGRANPELLNEYVQVENETGHDFRQGMPIRTIQEAIARGEQAGEMDGNWNM